MDNRIFNVNGQGLDLLKQALALAFAQQGFFNPAKAMSWHVSPDKGLILYWYAEKGTTPFMAPMGAEGVAEMVFDWLKSDQAKAIPCEGWDADSDHDGSNEPGWRVYVEDWGKVGGSSSAICAIKPAYLWYGK